MKRTSGPRTRRRGPRTRRRGSRTRVRAKPTKRRSRVRNQMRVRKQEGGAKPARLTAGLIRETIANFDDTTYECLKEPEKSYWGKSRVRYFQLNQLRDDMRFTHALLYYDNIACNSESLKGVLCFNNTPTGEEDPAIDTREDGKIIISGQKFDNSGLVGDGTHRDPMVLRPSTANEEEFDALRQKLIKIRNIVVVPSVFTAVGQKGDYTYDILQPEHKTTLFVFTDNTERRGEAGSASIRSYIRDPRYGNVVGISTGVSPQDRDRTKKGFMNLDDSGAKEWIDADITQLRKMLLSGRFSRVMYPADKTKTIQVVMPPGNVIEVPVLGSGVFVVGDKVKQHITEKIHQTVAEVNRSCRTCFPIPESPGELGRGVHPIEFSHNGPSEKTVVFHDVQENMLRVAWDVLHPGEGGGAASGGAAASDVPTIGFGIAGNAGRIGGGLGNADGGFKIPHDPQKPNPQEEGLLSNVHWATIAHNMFKQLIDSTYQRTMRPDLVTDEMMAGIMHETQDELIKSHTCGDERQGGVIPALTILKGKWGMINLDKQNDTSTYQLVDGYLHAKPVHYRKCFPLTENETGVADEFYFFSQSGIGEKIQSWVEPKDTPEDIIRILRRQLEIGLNKCKCKLYLTAGPQANKIHYQKWKNKSLGPRSLYTMGRTFDQTASEDLGDFFSKITMAYKAMFEKMDGDRCTVAIVPGLSSGLYAPIGMSAYVTSQIPGLIEESIRDLRLNHIREIIYCHG